MVKFPFYKQYDSMDCGPTCLRIVSKFYGRNYSLQTLREYSRISRAGVSILGISQAAEKIGLRTLSVNTNFDKLTKEAPLPCIVHWNQNHFVVVYKINNEVVYISDPAHGLLKYTQTEFLKGWQSDDSDKKGIVLLLEPTPEFYNLSGEKQQQKGISFLFSYLRNYKKLMVQLIISMLLGSLLQLVFPFLTQSVVDFGINYRDIKYVYLILAAQLMLFISSATVDFVRSWIVLFIGARVNINLISDFLAKLMRLPIAYFDTKMIGDLMQRIGDNSRIQNFLTSGTINVLFSFVNLVVFGGVLAYYNLPIFAVFLVGSIFYVFWIVIFLERRRELDFKRFNSSKANQDSIIQLINGMQEIKLHNCEQQKRWQWQRIQAKLYQVSIKTLRLDQYQQAGAICINQLKNIFITFLAAKAVIDGQITLGMMLSIQYIIGQLNSPLDQMIGFMHTAQDAKISLERLSEIHSKSDETENEEDKIHDLPQNKNLTIKNIAFTYDGAGNEPVLEDINLEIPQGKITAIVGASGSGKTTLIKLLLNFYLPQKGEIRVGNYPLVNISNTLWRSQCGVVMQDGYIFSETIANNIAVGEEIIDKEKLQKSIRIANVGDYIEGLPLGLQTKIGADGNGLSQGQKQRILIARAVYKDPQYLFFDEATNALDASNEKVILENLNEFFVGRTVIVVAHRLSTVKNANQIVVLNRGKIVETGTHAELTLKKGYYYELVKNQLELGN